MGRNAEDDLYSQDLAAPPEAYLPPDPEANSLAMLGDPSMESGEMPPDQAGPAADLAALGMMVQGAQLLMARRPGFVPAEVMMWLEQAMQVLPQLIQQSMSGLGGGMPGAGGAPMMAQTASLGPSQPPPGAGPSGPPRPGM